MGRKKATEIKKAIKEKFGINPRDYSLRWEPCTYSSSLKATVKNPQLGLEQLQSYLQEQFEKIDYCQASGEILSGGNTYTSCSYKWDIFSDIERNELRSRINTDLLAYLASDANKYSESCWHPFMCDEQYFEFLEIEAEKLNFHTDYISYIMGRPHISNPGIKEILEKRFN